MIERQLYALSQSALVLLFPHQILSQPACDQPMLSSTRDPEWTQTSSSLASRDPVWKCDSGSMFVCAGTGCIGTEASESSGCTLKADTSTGSASDCGLRGRAGKKKSSRQEPPSLSHLDLSELLCPYFFRCDPRTSSISITWDIAAPESYHGLEADSAP